MKAIQLGLIAATFAFSASAQSFLAELKLEHDPGRRVELALSFADESFDSAKTNYHKGDIHEGDEALDNMTSALNACVESVAAANKAKFYKKAEMKVAVSAAPVFGFNGRPERYRTRLGGADLAAALKRFTISS